MVVMDEQIKQAVEIAIGNASDYNLKQQAIEFLNNLKNSADGWQAFSLLLEDIKSQGQIRFVALQAVNDYIPNLNAEQNKYLRTTLLKYLQSLIAANQYDQAFLKNKLAESFASLFCTTYLTSWPTFFKDFEKIIQDEHEIAIDQYTRILQAIHSEIGDQLILRERPLVERNNLLKDSVRANDMNNLTIIWKGILNDFKDKSNNLTQDILRQTLQVIGGWVSWIEIGLIVPSDYINLILQFLCKESLCITAAETLVEIVSKKMKPESKLQLLSLLNLQNVVGSLSLDGGDFEFIESIAKLYNAIGLELSYILDSSESSPEAKQESNQQIIKLFPFILNFLVNPYDDVSQHVFSFLSSYLTALKKIKRQNTNTVSSTHLEILTTLLQKIILKMKYDDNDDGNDEDINSEFNDFRARLRVFQDTIAAIKPEIYMEQVSCVINQSLFENTNASDWRTIELGLYELTSFSDSIRTNAFSIPKLSIPESKPYLMFQELLVKTINSNVIQINHPLIQLLFFELIVRHYTLLNNSANKDDLTNHILGLFTSLGLYNDNEKVKLRCWYLFFRFVKLTKPLLNDSLIERLVTEIASNLLVIEAELPQKDEDSEISEASSKFDNQLYLFESMGLLISLVPNEKITLKLKLLDTLLTPIFSNLQSIISSNDKSNPQKILQTHHLLMAIGTIARGFEYDTASNKMHPNEIAERFDNTSEVVIVTLENLNNIEIIREAARFSFARFIPILKSNINNHLSRLISILLASNLRFSELTDFLSFIGQIIHNFNKDDLIYQLLNDLFTPLSNKVFQMLEDRGENEVYELMPDVQREKNSLKKAYLTLLTALTTNNVSSLLITQTNKSNLPTILKFLLFESNNLSDLSVTKIALSELSLFTTVFGNDTVNDSNDKYGAGLTIEGISSFLIENLVKLAFEIPFQNEKFEIKDAQFRFIADELANLLKSLYGIKKDELLNYLKNAYFPQIQLPTNIGDDLLANLVSLDNKQFKKYFVNFVLHLK